MRAAPIRVLHVITGLQLGGAETTLWRVLSKINREKFCVEVVSLSDGGVFSRLLSEVGVTTRTLNMHPGVPDPRALSRLCKWISEFKPDIIQTWMYHADLLGGIAAVASGVPVVWNLRQGNLSWCGNKAATLLTAKACAALSRWAPARIVCCSQAARRAHEQFGYASEKLVVIPNGFDLDKFRPNRLARLKMRHELGIPESSRVVGLVARYHLQKDHRNFLEACGRVASRDVRFLLCGNDIHWSNAELAALLERTGARDRCHLLGARLDMPEVMAALDVAVSSSFGEGFPNVVAEAMACGVPCVATDVGDSAVILGDAGRIVPPRDPSALAAGISELLAMPPPVRRQLGMAARRRILDRYNLASAVSRYELMYEELLAPEERTAAPHIWRQPLDAHPFYHKTGQHREAAMLRYPLPDTALEALRRKEITNEYVRTSS